MAKLEVRSGLLNYDNPPWMPEGESLTQQNFMAECDYNLILANWERTSQLNHVNPGSPVYLDVSQPIDYQSALNTVMDAEEAFMSVPARIRARFNNDPAEYVAFCLDPANRSEALELGLVEASSGDRGNDPSEVKPSDTPVSGGGNPA